MDTDLNLKIEKLQRRLVELEQRNAALASLYEFQQRERNTMEIVADKSHTHLAYLDPEFNFVWVNSVYAQGSGHSKEGLIGHNHFELFPHTENQAIFECVRDTGEPIEFQAKPFEFPDQPERGITYWDWSLVPVKDGEGRVQGLVLSLQDVTEIKRAQIQLMEQNRFITNVFESLAHPFYVIDASNHNVKMANTTARQAGLPDGTLCYTMMHGRSTPCSGADHTCPLDEIKSSRAPVVVEHVHTDAEGNQNIYEVRGHPILDNAGQVVQIIEYTLDITERKRAEEALRESEQKLQRERDFIAAILDTAAALVLVLDPQGRIVRVNRACEKLTGYAAAEVTGVPFWDLFVVAEEVALVKAVFKELQGGRFPNEYENYWVTRDGHRRLVRWSNTALTDALGAVEYIIATGIDVTARRQAEAALRESERKYRQFIENAQEGVWAVDAEAKTTFVNRRMGDMLGYTVEEMLGEHLFSFMEESGRQMAQCHLERCLQGIKEQHDFEFLRQDGTRVYASLETSPIIDENGVYAGALALVADITQRKQAEEALRQARDELEMRVRERTAELERTNQILEAEIAERRQAETELRASEERFRQLAENINECFWVADARTNQVLYVSPVYEALWGQTCASLYQNPNSFIDAVHPDDLESLMVTVASQSQDENDASFRIVRPDGTVHWIRARTFPIRDEAGQIYRIAGIAEDVTERMLAYQNLEHRVAERTRELSTLLDISRHVALTVELDPLLRLILDHLATVVPYDDATIFGLEGDALVALAHGGAQPEAEMLGLRFPLDNVPLSRQIILTDQKPYFISDIAHDTQLTEGFRQFACDHLDTIYRNVRSWMGVPLTLKDRVLGIMTLKHSEPDLYHLQQAELVQAFAAQAAVAIENHRLYEQAQALAAMEERQRLARDLHDAVSQTLFSASLSAEVLPRLWENKPDAARRCLQDLQRLTRGALAEMRALLLELRPAALLEVKLDDLLRQLSEAVAGRARLQVDMALEATRPLPADVQVTLYRIAQEALHNVVKHAGADRVSVGLRCTPGSRGTNGGMQVELCIEDNGQGFDPGQVPANRLGLAIMRERAQAVGAALKICSQVGHGTEIKVIWQAQREGVTKG